MNIEEIYVNLKVLQSLDKNQKLISRGSYLNIEPVSIIPEFLRRWHRQDNRNECLKKITLVVNSAIDFILHSDGVKVSELNSKHWSDKKTLIDVESLQQDDANSEYQTFTKESHDMKAYLRQSLSGIRNLKETYAIDSQTCARIDIIINKINHVLDGNVL